MEKKKQDDSALSYLINAACRTFFEYAEDIMFVKDMDLIYRAASMPFVRMVGKQCPEDIIGRTDYEVFEDQELAARYIADDRALLEGGKDLLSYAEPLPAESGKPRYGSTSKMIIRDRDGSSIGVLGITKDVTTVHVQQEMLEAARLDKMTMLLNREATMEDITRILKQEPESRHALFMIDVDNFKSVNDTLGHQAGDKFLAGMAAKLKTYFRDSDVLGRIGGDEFFILMRGIPGRDIVVRKADSLLHAIQNVCEDYPGVPLSGSIGISLYPECGLTLDELYKNADEALYQAKRKGKNQFLFAGGGTNLQGEEYAES